MKEHDKNENYWRGDAEPLSDDSAYHDVGSADDRQSDKAELKPQTVEETGALQQEQSEETNENLTPPSDEPVVSHGVMEPSKPHTHQPKKWVGYTAAVLLAAALAFGAGYAGVQFGYQNTNRGVTLSSTDGGTGIPASPTAAGALTSEQVAEKVIPSVVAITTEQMTTSNFWFGSSVASGAGSGVILTNDGYIVTNYHVVGGADTIKVMLHDGTSYDAEITGTYREGDLAVIKINAKGLIPVTFADSDGVKQGAAVYAVGNPEGTLSDSITAGIISALDRTIKTSMEDGGQAGPFYGYGGQSKNVIRLNVFQFDAAVSPGNSGGGLFNAKGELIGIVCAKSSDAESEGLSFALIGNNVRKTAEKLIANGSAPEEPEVPAPGEELPASENKAVLGIIAAQLDENTARQYGYSSAGVYIARITLESASTAGLAVGDRIVSIDSIQVNETTDVTGYLADKEAGDKVEVTIERAGNTQTISMTLQSNGDAA